MFALSGLAVLLVVGIVGVLVLRRVSTAEATREAADITTVAGRGVVQPALRDGVIRGDAKSLNELDAVVRRSVLRDPIVRVKIWDANGRIVYSDAPELIGSSFQLAADELQALRTDEVVAELSDLSQPENRFEREYGKLLEVYLPIWTPSGHKLLFEAYLRFDSVAASGRELWLAFLPVLAVALVAVTLLQIPLAYWLARRVHEGQRDRELLLQRAIDSSNVERRRIAGDLHDGPVQQLAGLSMSLAAKADTLATVDPGAATALRDAASRTRHGVRSLRSALMGIYPPTLERAGLAAALADLTAPLTQDGVEVELEVPSDLILSPEVEALLFRASQEAIRNVVAHAEARRVRVDVEAHDGVVVLHVADDGKGFSSERQIEARADEHLGLRLLSDLARDANGNLDVATQPGKGTRIRLQVPTR